MTNQSGGMFIYSRSSVARDEFVRYWAARYEYPDKLLYDDNIAGPHNEQTLRALFEWKLGKRFFAAHWPQVQQQFIARLDEARRLAIDADAKTFLDIFPSGGAIYRIFWIHCWQPNRFPIYDQHVHRAMTFIQDGTRDRLETYSERDKIQLYLEQYLPFWRQFEDLAPRTVDQALWAFGKFIKRPPLPIQ